MFTGRMHWYVAAALFMALPCRAAQGLVLSDFEPAEPNSHWFTLHSPAAAIPDRVALSVQLDHAVDPVSVYDARNESVVRFVDHQTIARLGVGTWLARNYALNITLPVLVSTGGQSVAVLTERYEAPSGVGIGDLRVEFNVLLPFAFYAVDLFVGTRVWLPTGEPRQFTSTGATRFAPQIGVTGGAGIFAYAARAAVEGQLEPSQFGDLNWGHRFQLTGGIGLELDDRKLTFGPEIYASTVLGEAFLEEPVTRCEVLFGAHYRLFENWLVGLGSGFGLAHGIGTPDVRLLTTASFSLPGAREPVVTTPQPAFHAPQSAPFANPPLVVPPPDRDRDSIQDANDACPDSFGPPASEPQFNGCPLPADQDRDGVLDSDDACLALIGVASTEPVLNGCPTPNADADADGINDKADACPDRAGPSNAEISLHGCPPAQLVGSQIQILGRVDFELRLDQLLPQSESVLMSVLQVLQSHPGIKRLRVEGHTDNRGSVRHNLGLSLKRAESVVAWLTRKGVDPARLVAKGWGSQKPIDTNDSEDGRRNNRRVEFRILEFAE